MKKFSLVIALSFLASQIQFPVAAQTGRVNQSLVAMEIKAFVPGLSLQETSWKPYVLYGKFADDEIDFYHRKANSVQEGMKKCKKDKKELSQYSALEAIFGNIPLGWRVKARCTGLTKQQQ